MIPCRYVIAAIGRKMDGSIFCEKDGIRLTRRGTIEVKDDLFDSRPGVFAGGDATPRPSFGGWRTARPPRNRSTSGSSPKTRASSRAAG